MNRRLIFAALLALFLPDAVQAQVYVVPRRAYRSQLRNYDFEWRHLDILVGPEAEGLAAPPAQRAHVQPPGAPGGPDSGTQAKAPLGTSPGSLAGMPANSRPLEEPRVRPDGSAPAATSEGGGSSVPWVPGLPEGFGKPGKGPGYATSLGAKSGGVRFYFYESERNVAQYAAPQLESAYRYLVGQFKFVPNKTFPYILYSSYQEFLQTNVFAVQEGTLGVTSTQGNLELSLPYLGDHRLFGEISTHEMAHQFTIQKVRTVAEEAGVMGEPLSGIPLWFIEGLAEYYAKGGLDPEAEMMVRDLLTNPDLTKGYAFLDFFSPGPYGFLWIYKVGQARVAFLEETYGAGTIQKVLEESPKLISGTGEAPDLAFEGLLELVTGDEPRQIAARFENWLKRRAYRTYLKAEQPPPSLELLRERRGIVTALNSSPDGRLLLYRSIIPETGESQLILVDPRAPEDSEKLVGDGVPGYESLHAIFGRNFALSADRLAFIAESQSRDRIYLQPYEHKAEKMGASKASRRNPYLATATGLKRGPDYRVRFELGEREVYELGRHGLIAAYSPAFSPDGKQLAFIGLSEAGTRDVYLLSLDALDATPTQLTHDVYAERSLAWGPAGIVFSSDATSHGYYNLFRVKPDKPGQVERLTSEPRDHEDPTVLPDGRLYFVAFDKSRADLHEYTGGGKIVRRTDVTTGVFEPCPGPEGNLWTLFHVSGERKPALLRAQKLLSFPVDESPRPEAPAALPQRPLASAEAYRPFTWENIDMGPIIGFAGAGGGGFVGQVAASASDRLRNHAMMLNVAVYGSLELTDGYLLYLNQASRTSWGVGAFQSLRLRVDDILRQTPGLPFNATISGERFFGVTGIARYPLSTFTFIEGDLSIGGASYFLDPYASFYLNLPEVNGIGDLYTPWKQATRGVRFQTELTTSFGYNTLRYHYTGTPIAGRSFLLQLNSGVQPFEGEYFGNVRVDAEQFFPVLLGATHLMLRGGAGTTFGGRFARSFYLSSFDTLRGARFGQEQWLLGQHYLYSTLELRVPLDSLIRVAFLNSIMGVAGVDFGGVGGSARDMWNHRILDAAVGFNVGLGPLLLRLHFAYPFDIGAEAGRPSEEWVTQFSIGIAGLEGFLGKDFGAHSTRPATPAPPVGLGNGRIGGF
ncbi:MAG TPA: tolB protein precursor protein [Myxococcaceae bacterium]|nr:tolB protein precursor protein [Myxococcaceae bacterium]